MAILYLAALAVALTGMVMLDRRFALFFWRDARRAAIVLAVGLVFFVAWDLSGIGLGIFFRGETSFMTGLVVAPEFPVEELFFLTLLCYLTMNLMGFLSLRSSRPSAAVARPDQGADSR
ncbi:lycopene cyclase domain-containing protein [Frigoribacterium sp. UYMn621]|uniref:lycopene cyclase domain-containing protein n=1 Tax=Frigoribacterium sp. UYMn621 TaxID=3156343 RepID=UPI00339446C1